MNNYAPLLCSEFKLVVQHVLDGQQISETYRQRIREHRESCNLCCNFHDNLLGMTAIAQELLMPEEYRSPQSSRLWNEILASIDDVPDSPAPTNRAATVSLVEPPPASSQGHPVKRLDTSKIDIEASDGRISDLAKFLFGPDEIERFNKIVDRNHSNPRIERVCEDTFALLSRLQSSVSHLPTVVGTMVLSPDGTILDSRLASDLRGYSSEEIGVWSIAAYHNAQAASNALGYSKVMQIVSRTELGYVIIAHLPGLTLIVLNDGTEQDAWELVNRISSMTK